MSDQDATAPLSSIPDTAIASSIRDGVLEAQLQAIAGLKLVLAGRFCVNPTQPTMEEIRVSAKTAKDLAETLLRLQACL